VRGKKLRKPRKDECHVEGPHRGVGLYLKIEIAKLNKENKSQATYIEKLEQILNEVFHDWESYL
jgi:hypothetical protein